MCKPPPDNCLKLPHCCELQFVRADRGWFRSDVLSGVLNQSEHAWLGASVQN